MSTPHWYTIKLDVCFMTILFYTEPYCPVIDTIWYCTETVATSKNFWNDLFIILFIAQSDHKDRAHKIVCRQEPAHLGKVSQNPIALNRISVQITSFPYILGVCVTALCIVTLIRSTNTHINAKIVTYISMELLRNGCVLFASFALLLICHMCSVGCKCTRISCCPR